MKSIFIEKLLETAARYENKVAFVDLEGRRSTTYGQLFDLARKVTGYLRRKGVAPHSNVCIRMPDTMEFMAAELGVWLSRCAAVPIGMNSPEERVEAITQNCDSAMLIDEAVMQKVKDISVSDPDEIKLMLSRDKKASDIKARIIFKGYQAVLRLMSDWKAKDGASDILLFRCAVSGFSDLPSAYRRLVAKLTVVEVPAEHTEFCIDNDDIWLDLTVSQTLKFLSGN